MEQSWSDQLQELLKQAHQKRTEGDREGAVQVLETASDPVKAFGTWRYARGTLAMELGDLGTGAGKKGVVASAPVLGGAAAGAIDDDDDDEDFDDTEDDEDGDDEDEDDDDEEKEDFDDSES